MHNIDHMISRYTRQKINKWLNDRKLIGKSFKIVNGVLWLRGELPSGQETFPVEPEDGGRLEEK